MQDRPDAHELAAALARFLIEEVRPAVPRELRFGVLVAANTAAILAREWEAGDDAVAEEAERLLWLRGTDERDAWLFDTAAGRAQLADRDELRAAKEKFAAAIRAGDLDASWDEALAVLRDSVRAKLAVAHPGYDGFADDGRG